MSRANRRRHFSKKHPASIGRSHSPQARADPAAEWERLRHVAADQAAALLSAEEPIFAECAALAATLVHILPAAERAGVASADRHEDMLLRQHIPRLAERGMLTMLVATASVTSGAVRRAASAAADRLIGAGAIVPEWARGLRDPVTVGECLAVTSAEGDVLELMCTLGRSGYSQAVQIGVDEVRCGAALGVCFGIETRVPSLLRARQQVDAFLGKTSTISVIDPAEFRRLAQAALDARAVHDQAVSLGALHEMAFDATFDDLEPGYGLLAALLRSRLRGFPAPAAAAPPHRPGKMCPVAVKS
jgi:hypothetical protein